MMSINRRSFLKSTGVSIALPALESLGAKKAAKKAPQRIVLVNNDLGLLAQNFVPKDTGFSYTPSRYLKFLQPVRKQFTSLSGVSHPGVVGGHSTVKSVLTCAPGPGLSSFKNSISLDQYISERIGNSTRFKSLILTSNGGSSLSWTRAGIPIPPVANPEDLFTKLFINGSKGEVDKRIEELKMGKSLMDTVLGQAKDFHRKLNHLDKSKFDEYLTSIRDVEKQMLRMQEWEKTPKPHVKMKKPKKISGKADVTGKAKQMYDLMFLALQTDSTRVITLNMKGEFIVPPISGVKEGYHTLSHHGNRSEKLAQLALIEDEFMKLQRDFLLKLNQTKESGVSLLDNTMVMHTSNMGNASIHDTRNMPTIIAGGNFKHGQHLAFDSVYNEPLANLYVMMLNNLGIHDETFASSTGTLKGMNYFK
ncbi:MAG: DUF1552 domain-containing protein [Lentisphaeraceae bacterium]|nr:DUF1552 domain-containing protein [Lentisphaeraceae bacterium]